MNLRVPMVTTPKGTPLMLAALLIVALKCAVLIADRSPIFFIGDSESHLIAASIDLTDNTRSYLYGAIVRVFAWWPASFTTLIALQAMASAGTAWLLAYSLVHFLNVRRAIAIAAGAACALDPLQLFYERVLLSEVFALCAFAAYLVVGLRYLVQPRLLLLMVSTALGIVLVALRVVYVPVALSAILLPALAAIGRGAFDRRLRTSLVRHAVMAAVVSLCLHAGYRRMVFEWSGYAGTYQANDGFFLASAWAPKLSPEDAVDPRVAAVVASLPVSGPNSRFVLQNRDVNRWSEGGLVDKLIELFDGDRPAANLAARHLAMRTLARDPDGIARVAARTYLGFFGFNWSRETYLLDDQGESRWLSERARTAVRERFGLDAGPEYQRRPTALKKYHLAGLNWYLVLALTPVALAIAAIVCPRAHRPLLLFVLSQNTLLLVATCFGATSSVVRYLHPLAFGCFLALGVIANRLVARPSATA